jgi:hypothetical protein
MAKDTISKANLRIIKNHAIALDKHAKALKQHSKLMAAATSAQMATTAALKQNTAALIAAKPGKTLGQKTTDAQMCMSQWLTKKKRVSLPDSLDPTKNMATDFRVGGPPEMSNCLQWVHGCLLQKGDIYTPDAASAAALCTKTLGEVVAFIASKIK